MGDGCAAHSEGKDGEMVRKVVMGQGGVEREGEVDMQR